MSLEHQGYIDLFPPVGIPLVPESVCEGFFVKNICRTTSHLHLHIFTSARLHLHISAHLHICTSTSLLIFTSSHIDIYICTSTSLHICTSTSLIILTSAHLHLCSSSHLTSAHLHICTSTSSHLDICTSTSSHLHICTAHICTAHVALLFFLSWGGGAAGAPRNATLCGDRACRGREMQVKLPNRSGETVFFVIVNPVIRQLSIYLNLCCAFFSYFFEIKSKDNFDN